MLMPPYRGRHLAVMLLLAAALIGCDRAAVDLTPGEPRSLATPAAPGAAQPFVAAGEDHIVMSWTEAEEEGHALRFALWDGRNWSVPQTVARGSDWFVNWADFPSVVPLEDGVLVAHWLQRSGPGRYSYDVWISRSDDRGRTWSAPVRPHRDGTETEHGFVSLFPHASGAGVIWLDGRRYEDGPAGPASQEMMLQYTTWTAGGELGDEVVIDGRVCDCCQTAVAHARAGPIVVYRGRSPDEVRDIAISRHVDGTWSTPRPVHNDGWVINACPVNGPAVDAAGDDVVVAWFTAAGDVPRVHVAFSGDGGASFAAPVRVDDGNPAGRVDVIFAAGGRALVTWLEHVGDGAEIRGRLIDGSGAVGAARVLASTTAGRAGGFPRMARRGDQVLLAWTAPGDPSQVQAATLELPR